MAEHEIHIGKKFFKATEWAAELHAARAHGTRATTPSIGQVLGIASLVLEDGGSEREATAAMLLDAIGDGDTPIDEIREQFGKKLAALVQRCVDDRPSTGIDASQADTGTWKERRTRFVEQLAKHDDIAVLRLAAADTLREVRTLVSDLRRHGSIAFARFHTPPSDQLAYYRDLLVAFTARMPRGHLTQELRVAIAEMERLVELDTATAAWRVAHVDAA